MEQNSRVSFPNADVIRMCKEYGSELHVPRMLTDWRVMLAIAAVESGGGDPTQAGHDCGPRHERLYDSGGLYWQNSPTQRALCQKWGFNGACSYGPWQMMLCNFDEDIDPARLNRDLEFCTVQFVLAYNRFMVRWGFIALAQIGEVWNTGREARDPEYVAKLSEAYELTVNLSGPIVI